jgi:predicted ATP-binding protein involved in virulence
MRIDEIRIKNFKGFEEDTFHLNPRFTVFIGDNAKGKTAVLNALSVAAGSFLLGIDRVDSRTIIENEIRVRTIDEQPKPQLPVEIEAEWLPNEVEKQLWPDLKKKTVLIWKRTIEKSNTTSKDAKEIKNFAAGLLRESREKSGVVFPLLAYYGTGRLWAVHEKLNYQKQEEGVVMAYTNALSAKASPKEFLEWYKTQEDEVGKFEQPLQISLLKAFKKVVTSIIPDNRWQDIAFDNKQNELAGIFTTEEGKKEKLKFTQLSDGYRNIVALAADLAFRAIQLNPHLGEEAVVKTPGIVLIDEIDMHLHPNWQKRIVDDLKNSFPNIQFVASTHSPFIVQSLKSEELIILDEQIKKDGDPDMKGIEDVAANEMGVEDVPRSEAFLEMQKVAEEYYALIQKGKTSITDKETASLRNKLNELEERFSNDPAFVASLRIERKANDL